MSRGVAFENVAILLQLISVKGQYFGRRFVGLVLQRHYFNSETEARNIDIRALVAAVGISILQPRAGINVQAHVRDIRLLADMNSTNGRVNIHLLLLSVGFFLHIYAAPEQERSAAGGDSKCRESIPAHVQFLQ